MKIDTTKMTGAQISHEIDLRQRAIIKFGDVGPPLRQALNELNRRIAHEQDIIDQLTGELKERKKGGGS